MAGASISGVRVAAIGTCVPQRRYDNIEETKQFPPEEVKKVVALAGVKARRIADESICSSDLCRAAADRVLDTLGWERDSIDALIMVTQSPDYLLPSTACVIHKHLGLSHECAAFDVGLGCSGYPYGLWLGSMMINSAGMQRVLILHGETPGRFSDESDRSVSLLFGDSGSATALEAANREKPREWFFKLHTDGSGYNDMIIEAGGFRDRFNDDPKKYCVYMNGANIFNFTIKRVPSLVHDTLALGQMSLEDIDYYIFHQSNQFIIKHLIKKVKIPPEKVPIILGEFGNSGGPSVPLAITQGKLIRPVDKTLKLMLLGYGVGLSWSSAIIDLDPNVKFEHVELNGKEDREQKTG